VRQPVHLAEAGLHGRDHEVLDILALDALGGDHKAQGLAVAAVEREGDAHLLAIVAADLQAVGAPAGVAGLNRDPAIVPTLLAAAAVPLEQEAMQLHDSVDPLGVGRCAPGLFRLAAEQGMHAAIAVGRQVGDQRADVSDDLGIGQRRPSAWAWRWPVAHCRQVRT
jgi:hypothetical protein